MYNIRFDEFLEPSIEGYISHGESLGIWEFRKFAKVVLQLDETTTSAQQLLADLQTVTQADLADAFQGFIN